MKILSKLSSFISQPVILVAVLKLNRLPFMNTFFWNRYSAKIDKQWGDTTGDYERITQIIDKYGIKTIFDIGAGSGRLLPLFKQHYLQITLQDISEKAKKLCNTKHGINDYEYIVCNVLDIQKKINKKFDLLTSNKVSSAIQPKDIDQHISNLCQLSNLIYVCESYRHTEKTNFWFQHSYVEIFSKYGFSVVANSGEEWILFMKNSVETVE